MSDESAPSFRRRISWRLEHVGLRLVAALLGALGLDRASALMGRCWRLLAPFNRRHARADAHLALALPELTPAERRRILADMWENLGRTAAETILLPRLLAEPERVACAVPAEELAKAAGGAVFVSLHTGNWEVVSLPLLRAGFETKALYKPLSNPHVEDWLRARREPLYPGGLIGRQQGIAVKLRSIARAGSVLAIIADQTDRTAIGVDFFGRPARAMPFPAILARRLGLPLFIGRTVRTEGAHFRIEGRWLDVPRTADAEADVAALTRAIHAVWEEWIRELPGQWMWAHRKWL
ncbi:MAG: lauroyl acyltransferase [Siculibacillus sp.]|nr:lauroyl acyltransferase [Siculibacillus sp.]